MSYSNECPNCGANLDPGENVIAEERKMKTKRILNIDTALRIFYSCTEIGNAEIRELFGNLGSSTISKYKKEVQKQQVEDNVKTMYLHTINTETAYKVWGIDIADLEKRRAKLKKLGM